MQSTSANTSPYPPPSQGYMQPGSQSYGQQGTDSENSTQQTYDYSAAAIDPALEGAGTADMQNDAKGALGTGTPYPAPTSGSDQHSHRGTLAQPLSGVPKHSLHSLYPNIPYSKANQNRGASLPKGSTTPTTSAAFLIALGNA